MALAHGTQPRAYNKLMPTRRAGPQVRLPNFIRLPFMGLGRAEFRVICCGIIFHNPDSVALRTIEALAFHTNGFHVSPQNKGGGFRPRPLSRGNRRSRFRIGEVLVNEPKGLVNLHVRINGLDRPRCSPARVIVRVARPTR